MVCITGVERGSYAERAGIFAGDRLLSIGGREIRDVLDYRFYLCERRLSLLLLRGGTEYTVKIEKGEYDDIGLEFETYLMDEKRRCANGCIFCFIDQNPPGMRDTVYFKDDDTRLSFLQGNYVTLTNLGTEDIRRIINMKMTPVNISVHTTNPDLRCAMLRNKNAGKSLEFLKMLDEGGIEMRCQIVLCKGINDGDELSRTMRDLAGYENVSSVSVVPVGLTRHRSGLYPLESFTREDAERVIDQVEGFAAECGKKRGVNMFYCSDEFYLGAGRPLPRGDYYDGYPQIENGVGMLTSLCEEFNEATDCEIGGDDTPAPSEYSIATGVAAYDTIKTLAEKVMARYPQIKITVHKTVNEFYGDLVTVAGLLTGRDILKQLSGKDLGERLLISERMLSGDGLFLCGMTREELEAALGVPVVPCPCDGYGLFSKMIGAD